MKWVYTTELCISLRLKTVEKGHKVNVEELEEIRRKAIEAIEKVLREEGFDFDGISSSPIHLVPDWWGD